MNSKVQKVMIFGRPGSGKTTFAASLAKALNLPLYHLDKHFFIQNWVERDYQEFLIIQEKMVNCDYWIIDGNNISSLEMRWSKADLVLYFNFPKMTCLIRILKRFLWPNKEFDDRAQGCNEKIKWFLLKYMWTFEKRVDEKIKTLKNLYQNAIFVEIKNTNDLENLKQEL